MWHRNEFPIDPSKAGLVIGKQGSYINSLKEIEGVKEIKFDTKSSYTFQVTGTPRACKEVYDAVHKITKETKKQKKVASQQPPEIALTLIDVSDKTLNLINLVAFEESRNQHVLPMTSSNSNKENYIVSSFSQGGVADALQDMKVKDAGQAAPHSIEFLQCELIEFLQCKLKNYQGIPAENMSFNVSPGKILFTGPRDGGSFKLLRNEITSSNGVKYIKKKKLNEYFVPNLHPRYINLVNLRLEELRFKNLNSEGCSAEAYTTVHLLVGPDEINFTVVLALDENLETPKDAHADIRLTDQKRRAVEKILIANTIGKVFETEETKGEKSRKVAYHQLCLKVHPDQNSHPRATEAFKRLQDSYNQLLNGRPRSTNVKSMGKNSKAAEGHQPPKVISVKTKKITICTITTLSAKDLDMRGNLTRYEEDKENLSKHVRNAVNRSWHLRDAKGKIPTPKGTSYIFISTVKQVLEAHEWVKEVPFKSNHREKTALVKIKIKKFREKSHDSETWQDPCVEFDLKLICDFKSPELSGESLACEMVELKNWVDRIFQVEGGSAVSEAAGTL